MNLSTRFTMETGPSRTFWPNAAGDDVAASTIDQLAIDLTDLRRARESALAELRGEHSEFEERD